VRLFTYYDAVEHLLDYLGDPGDKTLRDCKRAANQALRDLVSARNWSYLSTFARIQAPGPYSTGTVAYDATGGTYERQLTLTGGTWPSWAGDGQVAIGRQVCRVAERKSGSVLTLTEQAAPAEDVDSVAFQLFQDTFRLPADFSVVDTPHVEISCSGLMQASIDDYVWDLRNRLGAGPPRWFAVIGDPRLAGRLAMVVWPYPAVSATLDLAYSRRPRDLVTFSHTAGTVDLAAGSRAVAGTGTAWTPQMVGSVLRTGTSAIAPTSIEGANPASLEARVASVESATSLTLEAPAGSTQAGLKYQLSDLVDIEPGSMLNALLRGCERQVRVARFLEGRPNAEKAYDMALREAMAADSRSCQGRSAGAQAVRVQDFGDMPARFN
jgi:hypothetical protein